MHRTTPCTLAPGSVLTAGAKAFIGEWLDPSPTVTARTSGSTGMPKPITLSKADMRQSARATLEFFGIDGGSTLLLPLSAGYIAGKMQIVRALESGCRLLAEEPSSAPFASWRGTLPRECTLVPLVPGQIEGFMSSPLAACTRHVIVGGAPMERRHEQMLSRAPVEAWATYGMTETCSHVALRRVGDDVYRALPGISLGLDPRGCLTVGREGSTWGQVVTNDLVELPAPGTFRWLGRWDNVINSGGIKIHPEQVEAVMQPLLPQGVRACVAGRPGGQWGCEAVIVTDSEPGALEGLLQSLRPLLPRHHCPRAVVYVRDIPLTPNGKINRSQLKAMLFGELG